jgi:hypothetical protein
MGSGQLSKRGKGSQPCGLFGAIDIHHKPMVAQTIPQATWWKDLGGSHDQIFEKQRTSRLDGWLIQSSKKTTQRGAMRQALSTEERHEGRSKRGEAFYERLTGGFCTYGVENRAPRESQAPA